MEITDFIEKLKNTPENIEFQDTMELIDKHYHFEPISFINGNYKNETGENSGSCKLFSFAKIQKLNKKETLSCFGAYYTSVLSNPKGNDHQNIRNFIKMGWQGISFEKEALSEK